MWNYPDAETLEWTKNLKVRGKYLGDGSALTGITAAGDNLGNHIAIQTISGADIHAIGIISGANINFSVHANAGADSFIGMSDGDVVHGMTSIVPTDHFAFFDAVSSTAGGMAFTGFSDTGSNIGMRLAGVVGSETVTAGVPAIDMIAYKKSGTTIQALGANDMAFSIAPNAATYTFNVMGDGDIGIGTTTPSAKVDIIDSAGIPAAKNLLYISRTNNLTAPDPSLAALYIKDHSANDPIFISNNVSANIMVIKGTGNMGLGTSAPKQALHIAASVSGGIILSNLTTMIPPTTITNSGIIYVSGGTLCYKGAAGTITKLALS